MKPIALITGGGRGLGKEIAICMAREGYDIIITYDSSEAGARELIKTVEALGAKACSLPLDLSAAEDIENFPPQLQACLRIEYDNSPLQAVVTNAGIGAHKPFLQISPQEFDLLLHIHFRGVFFLIQGVMPFLSKGSSIVNIGSGLTRFALPGYSAFAAMKGGMETLTRHLARELGPLGIRVNTVAPGPVDTEGGNLHLPEMGNMQLIESQTALGGIGNPADIGGVVSFLCSPAAAWITGQRIEVSGGLFL